MLPVAVGYAQKAVRSGLRLGRSVVRAPLEKEARRLKQEAVRRGGLFQIDEQDGYTRFPANELSASGTALPSLLDLAERWKADVSRTSIDKQFPVNLLTPEDLFKHRAFIDLAVHDDILAAVSAYMGQVPRLYNLMLWWSPSNQTVKGSQRYHYDHRDNRQAKVFINLNEVTRDSGPLRFLTAADSLKVDARVGYSQGRYTDEAVYSAVPQSNVITAVGAAGAAFVVDTARCLHYGSRGNLQDRFILMVSFARVNSANPGPGCRVLDPVRNRLAAEHYSGDPVRAFVLTSPR